MSLFFAHNVDDFQRATNGRLYNWWAAIDINMFPTDWDIPTQTELQTLASSMVDSYNARVIGSDYWLNSEGLDLYGFEMLGTGRRFSGLFTQIKEYTGFWSSSEFNTSDAYVNLSTLYYERDYDEINISKTTGFPIRAIWNGTGSAPSFIKDIEGRVYDTVQIGTQYWLKQNWACSKLNNGTAIPNVTDNTAWSNLTTLAQCAYDNNNSNIDI